MLKPCPFCGSGSVKIEAEDKDQPAYVFCKDCVGIGPSAPNAFEAAYHWNAREDNAPIVEHMLNIRQVCQCLGLSRATIYRLIKKGCFPAPIHPKGTKASRWIASDIDHYQEISQDRL